MNWGPDHWSAFGNVVMALAAVAGAVAAFVGLGTWKKQSNWQSDNDLAKRVLLASFRYRDAVFALRNPNISGSETVLENGIILSSRGTWDGTDVALTRRLTLLRNMRSELDGVLQEAEAHWGPYLEQPFGNIFAEEKRLIRAVQIFIRSIDDRSSKEERVRAMQRGKEGGNIHFHSTTVDSDEFKIGFDDLISTVSTKIRAKLGPTP